MRLKTLTQLILSAVSTTVVSAAIAESMSGKLKGAMTRHPSTHKQTVWSKSGGFEGP